MTVAVFATKAPIFMRRLMDDFGFSAEDAAAVMGNAGHESGGLTLWQEEKPTVKGSRGGWGWFQWTGPRRKAFEAWCKRKGYDLKDDEAQYSFLFRELKGPEKAAVAATKKAVGLEAKVKAFEANYERAGVKHYDSRLTWAKRALAAYSEAPVARAAPSTAPKLLPTVSTVPAPVAPAAKPGFLATLWRAVRGKDAAPVAAPAAVVRVGIAPNGDPALYDVQHMLAGKGYVEVGQPDGLDGAKTRGAVRVFRAEHGLPAGEAIDETFRAALLRAGPRPVAETRVTAQAQDLRVKGNSQVATLDSMSWIGKLLGIGGLAGAVDQSGLLGKATETLQGVQDTIGTLTTILTSIIGVVQWCFAHWWMFALGAGLWIVYRATIGVLNIVVLFRQGILARADK